MQTVWVRDDESVMFIRGEVEDHDQSSGAPLVKAAAGRLKSREFDFGGVVPAQSENPGELQWYWWPGEGWFLEEFWSTEESEQPRAWRELVIAPPGFTMYNLTSATGVPEPWVAAIEANNMHTCSACLQALAKALFWHMGQPVVYVVYVVFIDAYSMLEPLQQVLGCCVAMREGVYFLSILACPIGMLVDVGASYRDTEGIEGKYNGYSITQGYTQGNATRGNTFLAMYVIAPEKFLALALFDKGGLDNQCLLNLVLLVGALLDLCALADVGAGIGAGNLPAALKVGYSVTVLGALSVGCVFVLAGMKVRGLGGLAGTLVLFLASLALGAGRIEWWTALVICSIVPMVLLGSWLWANRQRRQQEAELSAELVLVHEIFAPFDADRDGRLNRDEYKSYLRGIGRWHADLRGEIWTEQVDVVWWQVHCDDVGCSIEEGVAQQTFEKLYTMQNRNDHQEDRFGMAQADLDRCNTATVSA